MPPLLGLLLSERLAVGAGIHSRIYFMCANLNAVQRAVVLILAVVCALGNSTLDAFVCVTVHSQFLLFSVSKLVWLADGIPFIQNFPIFFFFCNAELTFSPEACIIALEYAKLQNM